MERSSSSSRAARRRLPVIVVADRAALAGLALGLLLYVIPFWAEGRLRWAFWVTLGSALLHVYTSHRRAAADAVGIVAATKGEGG